MNKKSIKKVLTYVILIVFLLALIICAYAIKKKFSPFQTDEEKQLKPVYEATMKGISGFKLKYVWIDEDNNNVRFTLRQKKVNRSNEFTEKELESINKAVEQLSEFLNANQDFENLHTEYFLEFQIGKTPITLDCIVKYINNQAIFYYFNSNTSNIITDYYMMKDVYSISMYSGCPTVFEEEKVNKLAELENLEKIYFDYMVDIERLNEFSILMKNIKSDCKIFYYDEEVVIAD